MRHQGLIIVVLFVLFLATSFLAHGCKKKPRHDTVPGTTLHDNTNHRLEFVDQKTAGSWEWKILRDTKTEKEWLIIHDRHRIVVVPFDSKAPVSAGMGDD